MTDTASILRDVLSTIAAKEKYENCDIKIKLINTDGANYSSHLYEVTISAPNKPDLELFGKVVTIAEDVRAALNVPVFDTEQFFYTSLLYEYRLLEEKYKIPERNRFLTANCYGFDNGYLRETVVLENLSKKNFKSYNRFESVTWEYAAECIKQMAYLHVLSVAFGQDNPEKKDDIFKTIKFTFPKFMFDKMVQNAIAVVKEEYREKFTTFLEENLKTENFEKFFKPNHLAVIAHGDFRPSNLMHRILEDGALEIAVVDFQTLQVSNPILDLLYYIINGTDEKFRQEHYQELIQHYYSEFCNAIRRFNLDPDLIYPKQNFENDLKEVLPFGLLVSIVSLPFVTVDVENAPKIDSDLETNFFGIKTSDLFAERLNGIISDYIKMGIL
ncbi:unnamed protein product [Parnassius apollo]|uniref:(apollo) hypothetical protein n=1 Tax=Parnassius apollo TaxID=110799 RepID=A0A8S3XDX5_PARAO|nr:unnamed protein product [Parnassius apollo]